MCNCKDNISNFINKLIKNDYYFFFIIFMNNNVTVLLQNTNLFKKSCFSGLSTFLIIHICIKYILYKCISYIHIYIYIKKYCAEYIYI